MENENINTNESKQENVNDGIDYIAAINEMKQNSVDKKKYDSVVAENKRLLDALVEGKQIETPKNNDTVDVGELRKKLYTQDLSNLEYIKTTLQLRQAIIDSGEQDPFLPCGNHVTITHDMIEAAEHTADVLQQCVDFAEGDSGIFTAELQRRTTDSMPYRRR